MSLELRPVETPRLVGLGGEATPAPRAGIDEGFGRTLADAVETASRLGHVAAAQGEALAQGTLDDVHGTLISAKEAEIGLKLVASVRNRLLDSFHELWRMNV